MILSPLVSAGSVEIIGHRGASYDAPENTVASFKEAWKQDADAAELDIYLTKDGQIIVIHDATTKRTTGMEGKVAEMTLADLRKLDAGKWKGPAFMGEKLPTLTEMLATASEGKRVFVEVKCGPEIVPELNRVLKASKLPAKLTPVISFHAEVISALKKERPDVPAYWLVSLNSNKEKPPTAEELIAKAKEIKADGLDLSASNVLDEAFAKKVKAAGLGLYVYTVNDPKRARRMVEIGVEGITTDRPGWLRERLAGK